MGYIQRQLRILLLSAFFIIPIIIANAQNDAVVVVGSGIVAPAFEALIEASETALPFDLSVTGTRPGLTAFCAGSADIVITNRPISLAEESECIGAGVEFYELLLGHNILALVTNPDSDFAQCLSQDDINTLFAPTAEGQISDWSQLDTEFPETPLTPFVPPNDTAIYGILDRIVDGDGIRGDAEVFTDSAEIIDTIGSEPGALAALDFVDALNFIWC